MKNNVLALGFFDSVHIGHRLLISTALEYARRNNCKLIAVTFDDNFLSQLKRDAKEIYLFEEKREILLSLGVDLVISLPSEKKFFSLSKDKFLDYIYDTYCPKAVVFGSDYRFGRNAEGDNEYIKSYLASKNVETITVNLLQVAHKKVASTDIRNLLIDGDIVTANKLLGQPYFLSGKVEHGFAIGKKLNFPTANIHFAENKLVPKNGVYAVKVEFDNNCFMGLCNIGGRPTFNTDIIKAETYILDFEGDLYGKFIKIYLLDYLRETTKFQNPEELKVQITKDIARLKEVYYD